MMENNGTGRRFRVEHRIGSDVRIVSHHTGGFAHHDALTPYVIRLLMDGASGEVVLIDEATNTLVARRYLARGVRRRKGTRST